MDFINALTAFGFVIGGCATVAILSFEIVRWLKRRARSVLRLLILPRQPSRAVRLPQLGEANAMVQNLYDCPYVREL